MKLRFSHFKISIATFNAKHFVVSQRLNNFRLKSKSLMFDYFHFQCPPFTFSSNAAMIASSPLKPCDCTFFSDCNTRL